MDKVVLLNTKKYAKYGIVKQIENPVNIGNLDKKEIYVVNKAEQVSLWRAILVDGMTQSRKTQKCFEILRNKIELDNNNVLVLFVTQANNSASVEQLIQRAKKSKDINTIIKSDNICRSNEAPVGGILHENKMIVDFWKSSNMSNMIDFAKANHKCFKSIIIVIDECDQGDLNGTKNRLLFIQNIEQVAPESIIKVIFMTATIANLSKNICKIAAYDLKKFKNGVVNEIIYKPVVEHHFVTPHESYIPPSYFQDNPDILRKISFPKRNVDATAEEYKSSNKNIVFKEIKALPESAKELAFICLSSCTEIHSEIAIRLLNCGFDVSVEMNSTNNKDFKMNFVNKSGEISTWNIPYKKLDDMADNGDLSSFRLNRTIVESNIFDKNDYSMPHVLQAVLFMMTDIEDRIIENANSEELTKLHAITNAIMNMSRALRRPDDYPQSPKVALVVGHLASRGVTFQDPSIDFTCTSFCFADISGSSTVVQRGAPHAQKFGRACGMLSEAFARPGRKPYLITTEPILRDALANEKVVRQKGDMFPNGTLVCLKDFVPTNEWNSILQSTKQSIRNAKPGLSPIIPIQINVRAFLGKFDVHRVNGIVDIRKFVWPCVIKCLQSKESNIVCNHNTHDSTQKILEKMKDSKNRSSRYISSENYGDNKPALRAKECMEKQIGNHYWSDDKKVTLMWIGNPPPQGFECGTVYIQCYL